MIVEVESAWRETGIDCPRCGWMTYTDGQHRPQCANENCLILLSDEDILTALITIQPEEQANASLH